MLLQNKKNYLFLIILITGAILRFYNINYDDFWIDETLTFWISDPSIQSKISFSNHRSIEQVPYLFNLIVKIYHSIFFYDSNISRFIPATASILSILTVAYLARQIEKNNSYLFTAFLISINIYLISYAQELRLYSTLFLFTSINLIFYFKIIEQTKNTRLDLLLFFISSLLTVLIHPFGFIIIFSLITSDIFFMYFKKNNKSNFLLYFIIIVISSLYYYLQINPFYLTPSWLEKINLKFFTNFYFSKFFGSRLMGLIFLSTLVLLTFKFRKLIFKNRKIFMLFNIIFLSYFLPILYSLIFSPILLSRYIIFVIIPIILLISYFTFKLKRNYKNIIIIFLSVCSVSNLATEETFKQFYKDRFSYKPDFTGSLKIINDSQKKNYSLLINPAQKSFNKSWENSIDNYLSHIIKKNKFLIKKVEFSNNLENVWLICIHDLNQGNCNRSDIKPIKTLKLNRIDLMLF